MISKVRELAVWIGYIVMANMFVFGFVLLVFWHKEKIKPTHQNHLGKTVVIQSDTLKIINYSHGVYGLNNGLAIDSSLVKDVLVK